MKIYQLVILAAFSGLTVNPEKHNSILDLLCRKKGNYNYYFIAHAASFSQLEKYWSLMTISKGQEVKEKLCLTDFFHDLVR